MFEGRSCREGGQCSLIVGAGPGRGPQAAASFVPLGHEFAIPSIMVNVSTFLSEMMPRGSSSASAPPNAPPLYLYSHQAKHFCHDVHHDLPVRRL